ncbi:hypothetical protein AB0B66_40580 [Catellatospora sp. NPDC049111]|uniref:hypothetical protein n=1 Tax=Catellatospora sp. NPDC049111 TaxID=3155271 RepID=UPI0033D8AECB
MPTANQLAAQATRSVQRVYVIPVSADGRLILQRHLAGVHTYWAYLSMARGALRTDPATIARRLVRVHLGGQARQMRLVHIFGPARSHPRAAVYAAALTQTAAEITESQRDGRPRTPMQALTVTTETFGTLDIRPYEISRLLAEGADPAASALTLPDLTING